MCTQGIFFTLALLLSSTQLLAIDIQTRGLLKGAAILVIDGKQQLLKVGQRSPEGVLLVEATAKYAVIETNGERQQLSLSRQISTQYNPALKPKVSIRRNKINQYITTAEINGKRLEVLVDTGANAIALSSRHATQLKINYEQGEIALVRTASGEVPSYSVKLNSVAVGGIKVSNVQAFVIKGDFPETALLGMSYLQHVQMSEKNGILYLQGN